MKICFFIGIFLSAFLLVGCHGEKDRVSSYLGKLAASQARMQEVSQDFRLASEEVSQANSSVQLEVSAWEEDWDKMVARLRAEESRLKNLNVPTAAVGLNQAALEQCRLLIETVEATRPLIRIADQINEANRRSDHDPAAARKITQDMEAVEARRVEVARGIEILNTQSRECEEEIRRQHQNLQREFGIALQLEDSPETTDR